MKLEVAFFLDEMVQQRAEQGRCANGSLRIGNCRRNGSELQESPGCCRKLIQRLRFQFRAFGQVPYFHETGSIGFGGNPLFPEPMNAVYGGCLRNGAWV